MLTRRAMLATTIAAAAGPAVAAPQRQGTLKIALLSLQTSDPHRHTGSISVQQAYVEGLTSIADDGRAIPFLAQSWDIDADGRRYVFHIRPGVTFHNGRTLTARDVLANATRMRDQVRGGWLATPMKLVNALEAPDDATFVMRMDEPYGPLLNLLSELWIMAPESEGWAATIRKPIGTGPFQFTRWTPNQRFFGEAHPSYWQAGLPKVAAVDFDVRDSGDYSLPLRAGDLHIARVGVASLPQLEADPKIQVQPQKDTTWYFWSFNNRKPRPPFDNPKVRAALLHAMDKPGLMKLVAGSSGIITNQMATPGQFWWDRAVHDADPYTTPDPARALSELRALGVEPAKTPFRIVSWADDFAMASAQAVRALGFPVEHIALDDIGARRRLLNFDWDLAPMASGPRADIFLRFLRLMSDGPDNGLWGGPQDKTFDEMMRRAVATVDLDARRKIYLEAWAYASERYWTVVTGHAADLIANRREVSSFAPGFTWSCHRVDGGIAYAALEA